MKAIVFSGGGAKGAYEVGVAKRVLGARRYDVLCGTSVGALIASFLAQYPTGSEEQGAADLEALWAKIQGSDIYEYWNFLGPVNILWKPSLYSTAPFRRYIQTNLDPSRVASSGKRLRVSSVSILTGDRKIWTEKSEDLRVGVAASASVPVLFEPTAIDGDLFVDGGIQQNTPLTDAITAGATEIDIVLLDDKHPKGYLSTNPTAIEVGIRTISTISVGMQTLDMNVARLHNRLLQSGVGDTEKSIVKIRTLTPSTPLGHILDFSPSKIRERLNLGYEDAKTFLAE
jgi:predicted acylesterase/phospholipase RssA